jgi:hypothetical protein
MTMPPKPEKRAKAGRAKKHTEPAVKKERPKAAPKISKPPHPLSPKTSTGKKLTQEVFRMPIHKDIRELFKQRLLEGKSWQDAMDETKITPIEAAQVLDNMMIYSRDGAGVYLLSERNLLSAMACLAYLQEKAIDEKVRVVAASKLADTAYRILVSKPYLDSINKDAKNQLPAAPKNTWDVEFDNVHENIS